MIQVAERPIGYVDDFRRAVSVVAQREGYQITGLKIVHGWVGIVS
jgi:hypothetical protein